MKRFVAVVLLLQATAIAQAQVFVNAPVAPEAVYVGVSGAAPGVWVIDVNGFGQGTGIPLTSKFFLNPNIGKPGVMPPLARGTSTLDAGGAGVLTACVDINGLPNLLGLPIVKSVTDMHLGQSLDLVFNNERINANASSRNQINPALGLPQPGNTIMVAPHPNPPRLIIPPPNLLSLIFSEEPTVTTSGTIPGRITTQSPPCLTSPQNLLITGNPFSYMPGNVGLFGVNFDRVFVGPQPSSVVPAPAPPGAPFTCRQQIGHFLYVLDRTGKQLVVVNSNTFIVLAIIPLSDPIKMAISPNLKLLAVANFQTDTVTLIDTDPLSPTAHKVVATIPVPKGPVSLAWQPEGEDLLVCSVTANALSVIGGSTLTIRKSTTRTLKGPLDVAISARQIGFGFDTATWFAYVLNSDNTVSIYESGPSIIGPDDIVSVAPVTFRNAKTIHPDFSSLSCGCWITHVDSSGLGQVSRLDLVASPVGPLPYIQQGYDTHGLRPLPPRPRPRKWDVTTSIGGFSPTSPFRDTFSGNVIVDIAFDDILNLGAFPDVRSPLDPSLSYAPHSGKGQVKLTYGGLAPTHTPLLMFIACADVGNVDVFEIVKGVVTGRKIKSVNVPGVTALCHYWRQ